MSVTESVAVPRAGRREWLGLGILALPTMLTSWTSAYCSWRCRS